MNIPYYQIHHQHTHSFSVLSFSARHSWKTLKMNKVGTCIIFLVVTIFKGKFSSISNLFMTILRNFQLAKKFSSKLDGLFARQIHMNISIRTSVEEKWWHLLGFLVGRRFLNYLDLLCHLFLHGYLVHLFDPKFVMNKINSFIDNDLLMCRLNYTTRVNILAKSSNSSPYWNTNTLIFSLFFYTNLGENLHSIL